MLDIEGIRGTHESDKLVIDTPFPSKEVAVLMFERAHHHRGLLLAEVERLREQLKGLASAQRERQWME